MSEGKADPIYMAHAYHTKVPHKAIMRYILHYTEPGDIVFDGFAGTGMTGVAAQMCGYADQETKLKLKSEVGSNVEFGTRHAVLNDLAPAATFISRNYNISTNISVLRKQFETAIHETENELSWMYETEHRKVSGQTSLPLDSKKGQINYVVWSDV